MQQMWMATNCPSTCAMCGKPRCDKGYKLTQDGVCAGKFPNGILDQNLYILLN